MEQSERFSSYRCCEGRTGIGQAVEFTCPPDVAEQVKEFLRTNVRTIETPTTGQVTTAHGEGIGEYTRYEIVQHDYAGGGNDGSGGYIEILEIKNPPDGRWGIIINEYDTYKGSAFTEWETVENARIAFANYWSSASTAEKFPKLSGFKRRVVCGALTPWFYAIGDEQLIGDYAFPEGLQGDSVYRFGRQFVVYDRESLPTIKSCMGTRIAKRREHLFPHNEYYFRVVYWNDGSAWDEDKSYDYRYPPRPVEKNEMWIAEAVRQFRQLLAGKNAEFTINFTDDTKFVGKLVGNNHRTPCAEGDYLLAVYLKGEKLLRGWVYNFKPTPEAPDIVQFVTQHYALEERVVERIEIKKRKTKKGGKKWAGAFFHPSR